MNTYQAVFILDDKKVDDGGDAFANDVVSYIKELGGQFKEKNSLGRKQFARRIKNRSAGHYWEFVFDLDPTKVETFEDRYRLNNTVLRLVVFHHESVPAGTRRRRARRRRRR